MQQRKGAAEGEQPTWGGEGPRVLFRILGEAGALVGPAGKGAEHPQPIGRAVIKGGRRQGGILQGLAPWLLLPCATSSQERVMQ
jgi:hypothetical protein